MWIERYDWNSRASGSNTALEHRARTPRSNTALEHHVRAWQHGVQDIELSMSENLPASRSTIRKSGIVNTTPTRKTRNILMSTCIESVFIAIYFYERCCAYLFYKAIVKSRYLGLIMVPIVLNHTDMFVECMQYFHWRCTTFQHHITTSVIIKHITRATSTVGLTIVSRFHTEIRRQKQQLHRFKIRAVHGDCIITSSWTFIIWTSRDILDDRIIVKTQLTSDKPIPNEAYSVYSLRFESLPVPLGIVPVFERWCSSIGFCDGFSCTV